MMSDGEAFLLVFVLIYLSDCLVWLPPSGYAAISFWSSRRFLIRRAVTQFDALRKGFAVLQPLPPFGTVFVGQTCPVSLSPEGLAPVSRENPNPGSALGPLSGAAYQSWDEITSITAEGHRIKVNGRPFGEGATSAGTLVLAKTLRKIRGAAAGDRARLIAEFMRRSCDERRARVRAAFFRRATASLRFSTGAVFFGAFFLLPFGYWRYNDEPRFLLFVAAEWILMWQVTVEYWCLHRRFYPELAADRWQHAILSLLFPQYAIRSVDALSKGFLAGSHPVAIAAAVAEFGEFQHLACQVERDALHPIPLADPESPASTTAETFHVESFRPALEALLRRQNLDAAEPPTLPSIHCPRCGTEYLTEAVPCRDCGGLLTVKTAGG
jgi:hypothetical protein